jgi:hypothetical protein
MESHIHIEINAYKEYFVGPFKASYPTRLYEKAVRYIQTRHVQPYIEWSWLRDWTKDTREHTTRTSPVQSGPQELHNVRVIDVMNRSVVSLPPGTEYLALSYVWGADSEVGLRCELANVKLLEQPGSLGDITSILPRTISDAMLVCAKLNCRFLWVDRLCIIQDDPQISEQLEQMATIYHRATLTIVALAGDGATHGLSGVSYPRNAVQLVFDYDDNSTFTLVDEELDLYNCKQMSTWHKRAWTYQEYLASSRLLFFTDYGLYLDGREGFLEGIRGKLSLLTEGPRIENDWRLGRGMPITGLGVVVGFSERILAHRSDTLRAISGIFQALYKDRTYYGIPLNEFENGIGWELDDYSKVRKPKAVSLFPTWSWASVSGKLRFYATSGQRQCSLAYWGWAERSNKADSTSLQWLPFRDSSHQDVWTSNNTWMLSIKIAVALAWFHGCFQTEVPSVLLQDCPVKEWKSRLADKILTDHDRPYLEETFQDDEQRQLFSKTDIKSLCAPGRLVANASKMTFEVDWNSVTLPGPDGQYGIIRTNIGGYAGSILLDDPSTHTSRVQGKTTAEFIALSVIAENGDYGSVCHYATYMTHVSTGVIYGCPCSNGTAYTIEPTHVAECHKNPAFNCAISEQERARYAVSSLTKDNRVADTHERARLYHLTAMSYVDDTGEFVNYGRSIPEIRVMMIAPGPSCSDKGKIYQRLGMGRIYLKRWLEASPVFDTVVLE